MLYIAPYSDNPEGSKALVLHIRRKGQRWFKLVCFGRKGHFYPDGWCEHTDALWEQLTPHGKEITKLTPFGHKEPPKRPKKRPKSEPVPQDQSINREAA